MPSGIEGARRDACGERGQGSLPIVFIHGLGMSAATWSTCMALLRDRHRVLVDLRPRWVAGTHGTGGIHATERSPTSMKCSPRSTSRPCWWGIRWAWHLHAATAPAPPAVVVLNTGPGFRESEKREG